MKTRLLALAARRPLLALTLAVALPAAGIAATCAGSAEPAAGSPRLVLNRVWFDQYPEKATDTAKVWIFLAGGIAFHEDGSFYKTTIEVADFERQGDRLSMTFLHDKKTAATRFTVSACDEKPPFDLCLDLADPPRGPKRYYGFGDADEAARKVPWSSALMRAAEGRAKAN